jgi:hypothetical protein
VHLKDNYIIHNWVLFGGLPNSLDISFSLLPQTEGPGRSCLGNAQSNLKVLSNESYLRLILQTCTWNQNQNFISLTIP